MKIFRSNSFGENVVKSRKTEGEKNDKSRGNEGFAYKAYGSINDDEELKQDSVFPGMDWEPEKKRMGIPREFDTSDGEWEDKVAENWDFIDGKRFERAFLSALVRCLDFEKGEQRTGSRAVYVGFSECDGKDRDICILTCDVDKSAAGDENRTEGEFRPFAIKNASMTADNGVKYYFIGGFLEPDVERSNVVEKAMILQKSSVFRIAILNSIGADLGKNTERIYDFLNMWEIARLRGDPAHLPEKNEGWDKSEGFDFDVEDATHQGRYGNSAEMIVLATPSRDDIRYHKGREAFKRIWFVTPSLPELRKLASENLEHPLESVRFPEERDGDRLINWMSFNEIHCLIKASVGTWTGEKGEKNWPKATMKRFKENNPPFRAKWSDGKEYEFIELRNVIMRQPLRRRAKGYFLTVPGTIVKGLFFEAVRYGENATMTLPAGRRPRAEQYAAEFIGKSGEDGPYEGKYLLSPDRSQRSTMMFTLEEGGISGEEMKMAIAREYSKVDKERLTLFQGEYMNDVDQMTKTLKRECDIVKSAIGASREMVVDSNVSFELIGNDSISERRRFIGDEEMERAEETIRAGTSLINKVLDARKIEHFNENVKSISL